MSYNLSADSFEIIDPENNITLYKLDTLPNENKASHITAAVKLPIEHIGQSFKEFIKYESNLWIDYETKEGDSASAYYYFDSEDLTKGTVNGTVTASLEYSYGIDNPPEEIEVTYTWTDSVYKYSYGEGENKASHEYNILKETTIQGFAPLVKFYENGRLVYEELNSLDWDHGLYKDGIDFETWANSQKYIHLDYKNTHFEGVIDELEITDTPIFVPVEIPEWETPGSLKDDESESAYKLVRGKVKVTLDLDTFGITTLDTEFNRTGYNDGLATVNVQNIDTLNLDTSVDISAALVDGKLIETVITNGNGISISQSQVIESKENEDSWTLEYGKETAEIEVVKTGLKLTFSDGTFYNY